MNETPSKSRKRAPELDAVCEESGTSCTDAYVVLKRFKTTVTEHVIEDSPRVAGGANEQSNRINARVLKQGKSVVHGLGLGDLSPITEISNNLSGTSLTDAEISTPKTILAKDTQVFRNDQTELTITSTVKHEGFQMPHNPATIISARRLNMDSPPTLDEMAVDELSFYEEDAVLQTELRDPHLSGLLSPERSPRRFGVIEKSVAINKFLLSTTCQQLLHKTNETSTLSSNTPAQSLRIFHSLSSDSVESSVDDEYMELFEMESLDEHNGQTDLNFPTGLTSLIRGQIKNSSPAPTHNKTTQTPEMRRPPVRRCLSMTENNQQSQPKTPELLKKLHIDATSTTAFTSSRHVHDDDSAVDLINYCFKRPDPPSSTTSPVQSKRLRAATEPEHHSNATNNGKSNNNEMAPVARPPVRKCMSMNDADILSALARSECKDEPDLIGDFSKPFALPLMDGRHRDLKSISSHTVARLLKGDFDELVGSYQIIDCRYPYEYEGGHIRGARNLYTQEQIIEEFLKHEKTNKQNVQTLSNAGDYKRNIIIFHCEFSSERGPKLSRFLRNNDRARNTQSYPTLDYPEIYLLHNGYKEFYETHAELCDPTAYRPMLEPSYNEAYRHFRAKSKSWNGDGLGGATGRMRKSRSRLLL